MNKKNLISLISISVAVIWVFTLTFIVTYKSKIKSITPETTIFSIPVTTTPTESFLTEESTSDITNESKSSTAPLSIDGNNITTVAQYSNPSWVDESASVKESYDAAIEQSKQEASSSVIASKAAEATRVNAPSGKADIVKAYNTALNKLKSTETFKCTKTSNLTLSVDSIVVGSKTEGNTVETVKSIVQSYINNNKQTEPENYNFINSNDASTGTSVNKLIPPGNAQATLDERNVKSATVENSDNGSYIITMTLGEDKQTLDKPALVYSSVVDTISLETLGLDSSLKISSLDITYSNAVIKATIDSSGRITKLSHDVSVSKAEGTGKVVLMNAKISMHGSNTQTYTISY